MNKLELESFIKSFLLFFLSLSFLFAILVFMQFNEKVKTLDRDIFNEMRVCSFDLKCDNFDIDFVEKSKEYLYKLYKEDGNVYAYFDITSSDNFVMKINLKDKKYEKTIKLIKNELILEYLVILFVVALFSILFSFYSLHPLRQALILTEEFIKDILHDFNTPLSALRLNSSMLKKEIGNNSKLLRIEQSIEIILGLQANLKSYLLNKTLQKEVFSLKEVVFQRVDFISKIYTNVKFDFDISEIKIYTSKDAFIRIIDNILSNAGKYNYKNGTVYIEYDKSKKILKIKDTGRGIKNVEKIFKRFYKEQERGIGIGLHIVKKLSDELGIKIFIESKVGIGTTFSLDLSMLILD